MREKLYTLHQNKPFDVVKVSNKEVLLTISTGKSRPIPFWKFQKAQDHLAKQKTLSLVEIRDLGISNFHPAYIAAILANVGGIAFQKRPIALRLTGQ